MENNNEPTAPDTLAEFLQMKAVKDAAKKANQERSAANSKRRLESIVQKKAQTIMIGALARFEERFGTLWGHGKPEGELTPEERVWRELWDVARTEVLNNGNNQIRAVKEELGRYSVNYEGYHLKMPVKQVTITGEPNEEPTNES
jgi:hypothetical protein